MLISIAVDHITADLAARERFHCTRERIDGLYRRTRLTGVAEMLVLSTCNRSELYAWCPGVESHALGDVTQRLAEAWTGSADEARALRDVAIVRVDAMAARHVARVAAGLESLALADAQILGQLRAAHRDAMDCGASGVVLQRMMQMALRAGKRVHTNTTFHHGFNSVGALAVTEAATRHGSLTDASVTVVGCGKTNARTIQRLARIGVRNVTLVNRTDARAASLADGFTYRSAAYADLYSTVAASDVVIVATASPDPILQAAGLHGAREAHAATPAARPLLIIDLAMPRNVTPDVAHLDGVTLLDLASLAPQMTVADEARRAEIPAVEAIVDAEVAEFLSWHSASSARAAIRPLHDALVDVCRREIAFAVDDDTAERLSRRIAAKLMARPMAAMREAIERGQPVTDVAEHMERLFAARTGGRNA